VQAWRRTRPAALDVPEHIALVLAEERSFRHHELERLLAEGVRSAPPSGFSGPRSAETRGTSR
jgi:hypothetical protein